MVLLRPQVANYFRDRLSSFPVFSFGNSPYFLKANCLLSMTEHE